MKVIITSKNIKTNDYMKDTVEKKMQKLSKYFSDDISVNVMLSSEKNLEKVEATIKAKGMVFRAESKSEDIYSSIDKVVDKLASQMSRFKSKLVKKHKGQPGIKFEEWPEPSAAEAAEAEELNVVRTKKLELVPLTVDDAIMQMELVGHNFYVFVNDETKAVNVVYKREEGDYGLLETTY